MKTSKLMQAILMLTLSASTTTFAFAHDNQQADCESCEKDKSPTKVKAKVNEQKATTQNDEPQLCNSGGSSNSCPLSNGLVLDPLPQIDLDKTPPQ